MPSPLQQSAAWRSPQQHAAGVAVHALSPAALRQQERLLQHQLQLLQQQLHSLLHAHHQQPQRQRLPAAYQQLPSPQRSMHDTGRTPPAGGAAASQGSTDSILAWLEGWRRLAEAQGCEASPCSGFGSGCSWGEGDDEWIRQQGVCCPPIRTRPIVAAAAPAAPAALCGPSAASCYSAACTGAGADDSPLGSLTWLDELPGELWEATEAAEATARGEQGTW